MTRHTTIDNAEVQIERCCTTHDLVVVRMENMLRIAVMVRYIDNIEVQINTCGVLFHLSKCRNSENRVIFISEGVIPVIIEGITRNIIDNVEVQLIGLELVG